MFHFLRGSHLSTFCLLFNAFAPAFAQSNSGWSSSSAPALSSSQSSSSSPTSGPVIKMVISIVYDSNAIIEYKEAGVPIATIRIEIIVIEDSSRIIVVSGITLFCWWSCSDR